MKKIFSIRSFAGESDIEPVFISGIAQYTATLTAWRLIIYLIFLNKPFYTTDVFSTYSVEICSVKGVNIFRSDDSTEIGTFKGIAVEV
jgi:hypothetical protein